MEILVEFLTKVRKKREKTEEDLAYDAAQRLINEHYQPDDDGDIEFFPIVLDLYTIAEPIAIDDYHVQVIVNSTRVYILKISWEEYKSLYQDLTHKVIYEIKNVNK